MFEFKIEQSTKSKALDLSSKALKLGMFSVFITILCKVNLVLGLTFAGLFALDFIVDLLKISSEANDYMRAFDRAQEKLEKDYFNSGHA